MDYIFETLGLHRCELVVSSDNAAAIHCYEKVGFVREGVARSAYLKNGKWMDVSDSVSLHNLSFRSLSPSQNISMAMLEDEWRAGKNA